MPGYGQSKHTSSKYSHRMTGFIGALSTTLIVSCLVCVGIVQYMPQWAAQHTPFVSYTEPPYITRADGTHSEAYEAGRPILLHLTGSREPYECWGEFVNILQGPVTYFLPTNNSAIISEKRVAFTMAVYMMIPPELPPGEYVVIRMIKPVCHGQEMRPFSLDMYGLTLTIAPPHR